MYIPITFRSHSYNIPNTFLRHDQHIHFHTSNSIDLDYMTCVSKELQGSVNIPPCGVGQHPDNDDIHVADDISDGPRKYLRFNIKPFMSDLL